MTSTWAACLTPAGSGAIAVLGIRGSRAWDAVEGLFRLADGPGSGRPGSRPQLEPGRFWLGRFGEAAADEVVLAVRAAQPIPWLELHCHGGAEVVSLLLEMLASQGVGVCSWPELEQRTGAAPWRGQVNAALAEALTARTAAILLDQHHGAYHQAVARITADLDRGDLDAAALQLDALARFAPVGRHLAIPWRVVVAGAPNAGKSSLVNALAGFQRSVISPIPGTTRDLVAVRVAVAGWPVELIDTAGLRPDAVGLEAAGLDCARPALAAADLVVWVLDGSTAPVWPPPSLDRVCLVRNKSDLPPAWEAPPGASAVTVSAQTGQGLDDLLNTLQRLLVPDPPPPGAAVPCTVDLADRVEQACRELAAHRPGAARACLNPQGRVNP